MSQVQADATVVDETEQQQQQQQSEQQEQEQQQEQQENDKQPAQTAAEDRDLSEISLWAHETPHLNQTDVLMVSVEEDDPVLQFKFADIPKKIREAEQYYDKCSYDTSTAILVKCITLYDEQYGEGWCPKALDQDRPIVEMPNCSEILEFARLLKEYALNLVLLSKSKDIGLDLEVGEDGKPLLLKKDLEGGDAMEDAVAGVVGGEDEDEDGEEEDGGDDDAPLGGDAFDSDSDSEDDVEDGPQEESYWSFATENLQMAFQIFGRYLIERSSNPDAVENRIVKDEDGKEVKLQYALGEPCTINIPATDLLPFLWRKDDGVTVKRTEICQVYLGDVYDALSDVHCEEEQWEDAERYLALSLKLRQRSEKAYGRGLASIHTKYATYYALRNQYNNSNKHWLFAASVFAYRAIDKIEWLYKNLSQTALATKCANTLDIVVPNNDNTNAETFILNRDQVNNIYTFAKNNLLPTIREQIYGGQDIKDKDINGAMNNILDYFSIIDNIYELYDDNLQDIADGKKSNVDGKTIEESQAGEREAKRVKDMVQQVMRTDELSKSRKEMGETLGFKKIDKSGGDIAAALGAAAGQTTNAFGAATTTTTTTTTAPAASTPSDTAAFVPTVKRKVRPQPAEDSIVRPDEGAVKKQKTEDESNPTV